MKTGHRTGGRPMLSPGTIGRAPLRAVRFSVELNRDLETMVAATGRSLSVIVRRAVRKEVEAWKRRRAKRDVKQAKGRT